MALQKNLEYVLTGRDESASKTMNHVSSTAEKMAKTFLSVGSVIAGVFAAERIVEFGKRSVEAFAEEQKAQESLAFAFQKFPALIGANIDEFDKLNEKIQAKTGIDHSQLASAQATLASFGLTAAQLKKLTPLVADYAAKTGQDANSAAVSLGKALLGNSRALKAIGVDFKNTGSIASNYDELVQALTQHVGGFAEAQGQTFAGQLEILKLSFQDVKEKIGGVFAPALTDLVGIMTDHVIPAFDDLVTVIGPKVKTFLDAGAKGIAGFVDAVSGSIKSNSLQPLKDFFDAASQKLPGLAVLDTVFTTLAPIAPQLAQAFLQVGTALTQEGVLDAIDQLVTTVLPPLVDLLVAITPLIPPLAQVLTGVLVPALEAVSSYITGLSALWSGNQDKMKNWLGTVTTLAGPVGDIARTVAQNALNIMNGVIAAINVVGPAVDAFLNLFSAATHMHYTWKGIPSVESIGALTAAKGSSAGGAGTHGIFGTRAGGGDIMNTGPYLVGENGPEVVGLARGQHVYPNGSGASGGRGSELHLHFDGPVYGAPNAYAQSVVTELVKAARQGHINGAELLSALAS